MSDLKLPDWLLASLAHYHPQTIYVGLVYGLENFTGAMLAKFYEYATYYRPSYNRDLQKLVDKIGLKVEQERIMYHLNGMGGYAQTGYVPPSMYQSHLGRYAGLSWYGVWDDDGGGMTGEAEEPAQTGGGVTPGQVTDWSTAIGSVLSNVANAAGAGASAYSKIRCASDPCAPGCAGQNCPGFQPGNMYQSPPMDPWAQMINGAPQPMQQQQQMTDPSMMYSNGYAVQPQQYPGTQPYPSMPGQYPGTQPYPSMPGQYPGTQPYPSMPGQYPEQQYPGQYPTQPAYPGQVPYKQPAAATQSNLPILGALVLGGLVIGYLLA